MLSSSSEENDYDDDFDRDSEQENDGEGTKTSRNNNKSSAGLQSPLGNNDKDESIVSSWDSSEEPKRERSRVFDVADETSNEGNAIAAMNSAFFKISDDEVDESTEFGDKSAEFGFSKDSNRKKLALSSSMGENSSNGSRKDIINSKANVKDAVEDEEDEEDDDDEDEDDEDQDVSDEENEDDNEEDDDDDDNDFSDSDTDDEEEKHGWEKMDHEGKEYYWNWDTEEPVFGSALMVTDHLVQNLAEKTAPERKKTTNM